MKCADCEKAEAQAAPQDHEAGGILHAYKYEGVVRKFVHSLKYGDMPRYSFYAAERMVETLRACGKTGFDMVTYVPVHAARKKQRGYDQSELIAADMSALLGLPFATLFLRVKNTKPQYDLNPSERRENMKGAFALDEDVEITGKRILLVDDIYTTGSTMRECMRLAEADAEMIPLVLCREYPEEEKL